MQGGGTYVWEPLKIFEQGSDLIRMVILVTGVGNRMGTLRWGLENNR
jgi:hypothetical protein